MASKSKSRKNADLVFLLINQHIEFFNEAPRMVGNTVLFKKGFAVSMVKMTAIEKAMLRELMEDEEQA